MPSRDTTGNVVNAAGVNLNSRVLFLWPPIVDIEQLLAALKEKCMFVCQ